MTGFCCLVGAHDVVQLGFVVGVDPSDLAERFSGFVNFAALDKATRGVGDEERANCHDGSGYCTEA